VRADEGDPTGPPDHSTVSDEPHAAGEADHQHAASAEGADRVPGHATANLSFGIDLLRNGF